VDLYIPSSIRLHGLLVKHRDNFTFTFVTLFFTCYVIENIEPLPWQGHAHRRDGIYVIYALSYGCSIMCCDGLGAPLQMFQLHDPLFVPLLFHE
jgi:hypothetical protein